jgi:hypothetical protein
MRTMMFATVLSGMLLGLGAQFDSGRLSASYAESSKETELRWLIDHPTIQKMHTLINEQRKHYGLEPLELDPHMCRKAQEHAVWMAETGYYQHSNLPWPEIIFYGPRSAEAAVQGWIYSPAHHGIMLGGGSQCGYGYMVIDGRCYWVGVFH